jgi:radical SAM/Cys-rich protein
MIACESHGEKRRNFKDAGRACPVDYHLPEKIFTDDPQVSCKTLYVVGGLYGNPFALDAIESMAAAESDEPLVVLNGDIHWFDKNAQNFMNIERRINRPGWIPLVGNVEAELRRQNDIGVGCGCAYPSCTSDASVSRSNRIHRMLSIAVHEHPECKEPLIGRAAAMTVDVAGTKVGITHGDEKLIGGWDCSRDSLQDPLRQDELSQFMKRAGIQVFATTHTCAAVGIQLEAGLMINNGAAGLPNFEGQHFGIITRIATTPPPESVFGARLGDLYVDAVPVRYDHDAYVKWFDGLWEPLSPAAVSYRGRIVNGDSARIAEALLGGFAVGKGFVAEASPVRRSGDAHGVAEVFSRLMFFEDMCESHQLQTDGEPKSLQANIGLTCNLACTHCHVESSPARTEQMSRQTMQAILDVMEAHGMETLDITGGAPEMNPDFEWLIEHASSRGYRVMVRTNLVILREPGFEHLPRRFADLGIEVIASLPSLSATTMEAQRGRNTFDPCIDVLRELNELGYGTDPRMVLDLVYNPQTPFLSPDQAKLEALYKRRLAETYGITFNNLFAIANCPIGRYGVHLLRTGDLEAYMDLLMDAFNPEAAETMMCRRQISVGWDGRIYDCDFNQAIGLVQRKGREEGAEALTIFDYAADPELSTARQILFGHHCYACTAGQGSSCEGTLVQGAAEMPVIIRDVY